MKVNTGIANAISSNSLKVSLKEKDAKEQASFMQELAILEEDVRSLRHTVLQLFKLRSSSEDVVPLKGNTADQNITDTPSNEETDLQRRERVARVLKKHFTMMDIAAGIYEYDWFNFSLGLMGPFYSDKRAGKEFVLPPHTLDGIRNDIIRVDNDPNDKTNPNYEGHRLDMGVWSWGRRNKLLNYLMNNAYEHNNEEWRTIEKQDYALSGTLSLGEWGSRLGSV